MRKWIHLPLVFFCLITAKSGIAQSCLGTVTLNIVAAPSPDITGSTSICIGGSTVLSVQAGFASYDWSTGGNTSSITVNAAGTYTVTVTNATGCSGTDVQTVTIGSGPTPNIAAAPYQCNGQFTLDAGAGYNNYAWSNSGNGQTTTVSNSGTYTVTVTDINGCTGTDDFMVTIPSAPVVDITGNLSFCSNSNTLLTATPGFSSYAWTGGGSGQTLSVTAGGTYSVTASDAFGCTDVESVLVQENPFSEPTISGGSLLCPGATLTLTANGPNYQDYAWSNAQNTQSITINAPGPYSVTVTATNGCTGTASISILPASPVNTSISGNPVICQGGSTTLTATGSFSDYSWSNGLSGPTISVNQVGQYTVTVTSSEGCTGTASITTTLGTPPTVTISPVAQPICEDSNPIQLQGSPTGGTWTGNVSTTGVISPTSLGVGSWQATYTFVDANGCIGSDVLPFDILPNTVVAILPAGPFCPTDNVQTLTATPVGGTWGGVANALGQINPTVLGPGTYQVSYLASQSGACPTQALAFIDINLIPTANISGSGTICSNSGQPVPLNLSTAGTGNIEVTYTINGLSPTTVSLIAGTSTTINATEPGLYQISNVVDGTGCQGVGSGAAEVFLAPALNTTNLDVQCDLANGTFTVSFTVTGGVPSSYTVNSVSLPGPPYQFTSTPIASGDYYLFVVNDVNNCDPISLAGTINCNCATNAGNMNLSPQVFCEGSPASAIFNNNAVLDGDDVLVFVLHSGNGNVLGTIYATNTTPNFAFVSPLVTGQTYYISAVVGNNDGSGGVDLSDPCLSVSFGAPVSWTPFPSGILLDDSEICAGGSANLVFSLTGNGPFDVTYTDGIGQFALEDIPSNYTLSVTPTATTNYTLQQVSLSQAPFCSTSINSSVTVTVNAATTTNATAQICEGGSIVLGGSAQTQPGIYSDTLSTSSGCDSIILTTLSVIANDTSYAFDTSCNPAQTGVFTNVFAAQSGCDSVVVTTIAFSAVDSTFLSATTCDPVQSGVFTQSLTNQLGCDSLVITTVTLLPSTSTTVFDTSCDPAQTGVFTNVFAAQNGCDSVVVTTITYSAVDSTLLSATTCDPTQAGVFNQSLTNQLGCDSLVITTVALLPSTTTTVFDTSCDPSQTGVFTNVFTAQNGCDSVVVTTITYSAVDTTLLSATTCDPSQAGIFTQSLTNQFGCDSLIISTVTLVPSTTTSLTATTCDATQAGVFTQNLMTWQGCDSTVTTTVTLLPKAVTSLSATTCDATQTGVFTQNLMTWQGCDSIVTTTVTLLPSTTTSLSSTTCDPTQAGTFVQNLATWLGCDSTVTTVVTLLPSATTSLTATTCDPTQAGIFTQNLSTWLGCDSTVTTTITWSPPPILSLTASDFNGFGVSCEGAADGWVQASASGVSPISYSWQNSQAQPLLEGLAPSQYAVTVTDGNGCTVDASIDLVGPETLMLSLAVTGLDCFDNSSGGTFATATGGVPPYAYRLRPAGNTGGSFQTSGSFGGLGAGAYEVSVLDANGCSASELVAINAPVPLSVELGEDITIELGEGTSLGALASVPWDSLVQVDWSGIGNVECQTCPGQQVYPLVTTAYSVTVVDGQGCLASDGLTVYVDRTKSVYVPNAFSPNGDGINDLLTVFAKPGQVERIRSFQVFDRWGESVYRYFDFQPNDPAAGWDGAHRGQPLDAAVFVWFAEVDFVDGTSALLKGDVVLVR